VIFDFDGTLVDSLSVALAAYNAAADRLRVRVVSEPEVHELRALGARRVIQRLEIPLWRLPRVVSAVRAGMKTGLSDAYPQPGVVEALTDLAESGCALALLTSNSRESAGSFLARHSFPGFDQIVGEVGVFGKARGLRKMLRSRSERVADYVYVGDEVRDIEAARSARIRVAAVGWGYNHPTTLKESQPDALIEHPAELAQSVIGLFG
jgi:phosphoglycolate phosphatase